MVKIIFLIVALLAETVFTQNSVEIKRLNSTRSDVLGLLGRGQEINEVKTVYELLDKKLLVYYYGKSCNEDFMRKYNISKDTVMALTLLSKNDILVNRLELVKLYTHFDIPNEKNAYLQSDMNQVLVTKSKDKDEFLEIEYKLPLSLWSSDCSQNYLDEDSGINLFNNLQKRSQPREEHVISLGGYFSSDSTGSKKEAVEAFCQRLNEFPKGVGVVSIFLKKNESKKRYYFYENQLTAQLRKNKCNLSQVTFVKSGVSGKPDETFIHFQIVPKKIEILR